MLCSVGNQICSIIQHASIESGLHHTQTVCLQEDRQKGRKETEKLLAPCSRSVPSDSVGLAHGHHLHKLWSCNTTKLPATRPGPGVKLCVRFYSVAGVLTMLTALSAVTWL